MADEVMAKENAMRTPVDTARDFYAAIAAGDTGKMIALMAPDIEWIGRASHQLLRNFLLMARRWCH